MRTYKVWSDGTAFGLNLLRFVPKEVLEGFLVHPIVRVQITEIILQ